MEDKIDLQDISLIVPIRIDTNERGTNLTMLSYFYSNFCSNVSFIFIENDNYALSMTESWVVPNVNDIYCFIGNNKEFNKCLTYNIGAKLSKTKYLCFLDLDVIVNPLQIIKAKEKLIKNNMDLMIAYNGLAYYLSEKAKNNFMINNFKYEFLKSIIPESNSINYKNDDLLIGNNQAVGGCLVVKRDTFFKFKGFNPHMVSWGYEDNEIISRVQKLGYNVGRINGKKDVLWHFPHENENSKPKEQHSFYEKNHQIVSMVESSTKEQLKEYIKTWEI
jgi:predicted glycosyltransferase involved in capsule biosynthesis